jgi:hypothetical protein
MNRITRFIAPRRFRLGLKNFSVAKAMQDEYGIMDSSGSTFTLKNFVLESGCVLPEAQVQISEPMLGDMTLTR